MAGKEVFKDVFLGLALVLSFMLIVSIVAAQLPAPPPTPGTPGEGSGAAPPTPGTPPAAGSDSSGSTSSGGSGDIGRRHVGEGYTYGESGSPQPGSGEITASTREAPPHETGSGIIGGEDQSQPERALTDKSTSAATDETYIRIILLAILILLAIAAIIWAVLRWRAHHKDELITTDEIKAMERDLYLGQPSSRKTSGKKSTQLSPRKR